MAVPPVSIDDFALATVATRPDEAGGPPPQVLRATGQPPPVGLVPVLGGEPADDVQAVTIVGSAEVLSDELRFEGCREFAMPAALDLDDRAYERRALEIIGDRGDMDVRALSHPGTNRPPDLDLTVDDDSPACEVAAHETRKPV